MNFVQGAKKNMATRLGRSDRSAAGRWFWEIDRVLLLLVAVLISIGLIAVAAASTAFSSTSHSATCSFGASSFANIGPASPIV